MDNNKKIITINETFIVIAFLLTIMGFIQNEGTTLMLLPSILTFVLVYSKVKMKPIKYLAWVTLLIACASIISRNL